MTKNTMKLTTAALLLVVKGCSGFASQTSKAPTGTATAPPTFPAIGTLPPSNKVKAMSNTCGKHDYNFDSCTTCDCAGRVLDYGDGLNLGTVTAGTNTNCIYYGEHSLTQINVWAEQQCNKDCDCDGFYNVIDNGRGAMCFKGSCECGTHTGNTCHTKILPTNAPTRFPTHLPTKSPTTPQPTKYPTKQPTKDPTKHPTPGPTTKQPTKQPTSSPTMRPTANMCAQYQTATTEFVPERCKCQAQCENPFQAIQTKRNIFVVDMSDSMTARFTEDGVYTTRMEQMKLALAYQLTNLTSTQFFLVIKFANDVETGTWQQATQQNVDNYVTMEINLWKASTIDGTSTKAALTSAYAQATLGKKGDYGVYLLSDGTPNPTGGQMTAEEIQDEQSIILAMAKNWRKVYSINTIAWVQGCATFFAAECTAARTFMSKLASRTHGKFRSYTTLETPAAIADQQNIQWGIDACKRSCDNLFGTITQQKVAFVIDTSASMQYQDASGKSRLDSVKTQLAEQLSNLTANGDHAGLGPSQSFIFITFNTVVNIWPAGGLTLATNANKTLAIREMQSWTPQGETHTETALKAALAMDVDVIYLLSDGVPEVNGNSGIALQNTIVLGVTPGPNLNSNWNTHYPPIPINTIVFTRGGDGQVDETPADKKLALTFMENVATASVSGGVSDCVDCNCNPCKTCGHCPVSQ